MLHKNPLVNIAFGGEVAALDYFPQSILIDLINLLRGKLETIAADWTMD
jgi:hypothetical protein